MGSVDYSLGPAGHKEQNVAFHDQMQSFETRVPNIIDETRTQQDTHDATLANFFARPIKIVELEWAVGATLYNFFDPWSLYLEDARVSNRIANFNMLRCKLHLKFVINGNGFMYSRVLVSYLPLAKFDNLTQTSALFPNNAVQESQMPHIYLNPTTSTGGDLILPFVWHYNNVYIPTDEWDGLGQIQLRSLAPLKHANGATGVSTISVFAWAEDMELNVLTSVDPTTMTPQMGEIAVANQTGVVSKPATAVAKLANALSTLPAIRPYAKATEIAANAVASVAASLGYSRPPVTRDAAPMKPIVISSLALTTVPDCTQKLTLDDLQELSIDPRIAGLEGSDPLVIKDIAKRESYLTNFEWGIGVAPGTLLWNARVDPVTWAQTSSQYHFPACCIAAMPFKYWSGTMKFRFQILSSAYHKGRLKITYDPNWVSNEEFNTMYTRVIDLAAETDFTISVSNGQELTLMEHHLPGLDSVTQLYSTTRYTSKEVGNGVLAVSVLNELTTPNSTIDNDIQINVFVSMGDDFEVFVPDNWFANFVYAPPLVGDSALVAATMTKQMGETTPDAFVKIQDAPEQSESITIGPTMSGLDKISLVYTGESVKSFRTLLKRYALHTVVGNLTTFTRRIMIRQAYFPFLRGYVPNAINLDVSATPYNYCNTLLLHFITNCFSGFRGSIRYKIIPRGNGSASNENIYNCIEVERAFNDNGVFPQYSYLSQAPVTPLNISVPAHGAVQSATGRPRLNGITGKMLALTTVNPVAEVEIPFYDNKRFIPGKILDLTGVRDRQAHELPSMLVEILTQSTAITTFDFYVAAGEDYTTYFWTGCPPMWFEGSPPSPFPT